LEQAGWKTIVIDAERFRRIPKDSTTQPPYSGVAAVRDIRAHGDDPHTWIVELGTNDIGHTGTNTLSIIKVINTMLDEIGPGHHIVWINIYQGQQPERTETWNRVLEEVVAGRTDVVLGDWAAVAKTSGYLIEDHVHLTAKGVKAFADIIAAATGEATTSG
jgi:lysophospholipase L1-like esterase